MKTQKIASLRHLIFKWNKQVLEFCPSSAAHTHKLSPQSWGSRAPHCGLVRRSDAVIRQDACELCWVLKGTPKCRCIFRRDGRAAFLNTTALLSLEAGFEVKGIHAVSQCKSSAGRCKKIPTRKKKIFGSPAPSPNKSRNEKKPRMKQNRTTGDWNHPGTHNFQFKTVSTLKNH